jgi:hypothetical protein
VPPVPTYELLFSHDFDSGDQWLYVGDAFRYQGETWHVDEVQPGGRRILLRPWPNEKPLPRFIKGERGGTP